jgi:competence protein ComEC
MASIAFFALETGRLYSAWRGLVIAGLIMLVIVPDWLTDLGFILSFVATASILAFKKRIDQIFAFLPDVLGLKKDFTTSLAAQIGVGPILFATFSQFNLLSPLVNGLALWTIPPITVLGLVGGLTGLIFPLLGRGILLLTLPLTVFFSGIVKLFG